MENTKDLPLFMTHHAPTGSWSSFTFGAAGRGVSIDLEAPQVSDSADFLVGAAQDGVLAAFPFQSAARVEDELTAEGNKEVARAPVTSGWSFFAAREVRRELTAYVDTYRAANLTLRAYTLPYAPEDPAAGAISARGCCPGVLLELTVDNTRGTTPATAFMGLGWKGDGRIYTVDTAGVEGLSGLGWRSAWMMAGDAADGVFTRRGYDLEQLLRTGRRMLHQTAAGALCRLVPPGEVGVLTAAFAFYKEGAGSNGIDTHYYYTRHFHSAADVCRFLLAGAPQFKADAIAAGEALAARVDDADAWARPLLAQAAASYAASTQLLEGTDGDVYYNVGEGAYVWRNTMDLAADHLPWEMAHSPWVVRNILDLYIRRYSYRDTVRFREYPGEEFPGGLSFTHDMGNYFTYSPAGYSGYERETTPRDGCYRYMTTEELLNGIYLLAAYALRGGDDDWTAARADVAAELLHSLQNRDDPTPARRDGVLKAESTRCGPEGCESTTYDALDHALMDVHGSLYIHVKTIAATAMLEAVLARAGRPDEAAEAGAMRRLAEEALPRFWDDARGCLRANLYADVPSMVAAAVEPLGVLHWLRLDDRLTARTRTLLARHAARCLQPGGCVDERTGGLHLSGTSQNTWVSKAALTLFVMQHVLGVDVPARVIEALRVWCQEYARETTVSDQILLNQQRVIGGLYYPRAVTLALYVK